MILKTEHSLIIIPSTVRMAKTQVLAIMSATGLKPVGCNFAGVNSSPSDFIACKLPVLQCS